MWWNRLKELSLPSSHFYAYPLLIPNHEIEISILSPSDTAPIARVPLSLPDLPSSSLSTILGATVTYQGDHLSPVRAGQNSFNVCAVRVVKAEPEHGQVIFRVL